VRSLIDATERIAGGNLDDPVEASSRDEIGTLGRSFDDMRAKLARSLESIQRHSDQLETRVAERTEELQKSREKLAILLREIITAEEEERKRIARELHDDTSQSLNAILISLDGIGIHFSAYDPVRKQLMQIREQCLLMLKGLHQMIRDLRPPVLDDLGLESAIKWVLERHIGERGGRFSFTTAGNCEELKARSRGVLDFSRVELVLFRVVQEAIINISKHADAKNVSVSVIFGDDSIEMEIEDDGRGFDSEKVFESFKTGRVRGLGLLGMEERISLLDGKLSVKSEPGVGTRIEVFVPIPLEGVPAPRP
ncbi:MAG: ATP-binding protein, partial [Deltaproteobacteria bacterium]